MRAERLRWHDLLSTAAGGFLLLGWLFWRRAALWPAKSAEMLPDNSGRLDQFLSLDGAPRSCHCALATVRFLDQQCPVVVSITTTPFT